MVNLSLVIGLAINCVPGAAGDFVMTPCFYDNDLEYKYTHTGTDMSVGVCNKGESSYKWAERTTIDGWNLKVTSCSPSGSRLDMYMGDDLCTGKLPLGFFELDNVNSPKFWNGECASGKNKKGDTEYYKASMAGITKPKCDGSTSGAHGFDVVTGFLTAVAIPSLLAMVSITA